MSRVTALITGFAMALMLAPTGNAVAGNAPFGWSLGPVGPIPLNPSPQCDPNYAGACVPIASDVDCLGGGGNGPAYVKGPVKVIGKDIYGLDRDGNGIGCE